jgi:hypothetical protein
MRPRRAERASRPQRQHQHAAGVGGARAAQDHALLPLGRALHHVAVLHRAAGGSVAGHGADAAQAVAALGRHGDAGLGQHFGRAAIGRHLQYTAAARTFRLTLRR